MERKTNWIAVVVSVVAGMFIGFLWYGMLFQAQWGAGNNVTAEGGKFFKNGVEMSSSPAPMIFNIVAMVVYALLVNWLLGLANARTWMDGAKIGGAIGLIMAINECVSNMFAMNPASLSMVDGSYALVIFTLFGAILGGWQKK